MSTPETDYRYIHFGRFMIGIRPLRVECEGIRVRCTHCKHKKWSPRSVRILIVLVENRNTLIRASDVDELNHYNEETGGRRAALHRYISRLKCCLGADIDQYLETVTKVDDLEKHEGGYRFKGDVWFTNDPTPYRERDSQEARTIDSTKTHARTTHIVAAKRTYIGHKDAVNSVAVIDEQHLLSGSTDSTIRLWDVRSGKCLHVFEGHSGAIADIAVLPNHRQFVSCAWDGTLRLWDIGTRKCLQQLKGHTRGVCAVAVTQDGRRLVSGSADCTLRIWSLHSRRSRILQKFEHAVYGVALTPNGNFVVASSLNAVMICHIDSGECVRKLDHDADVFGVMTTANGKYLVACLRDGTLRVWEMSSGRHVALLQGHGDLVLKAVMTSDDQHLISCSSDGSARMWDLAGPCTLCAFKGHDQSVNSICLLPNQREIITGSNDKTVRRWHLPLMPFWVFVLGFEESGPYDCSDQRIKMTMRGDAIVDGRSCCRLNGGHIDLARHPKIDCLQSFVIEAVIAADSVEGDRQNILEAQCPGIAFYIHETGRLVGSINTAKGWIDLYSEKALIQARIATRIRFSRDETGKIELRINDAIVAEKYAAETIQKIDEQGFRIGAWTNEKRYLFRGKIEELKIGKLS